MALIEVSEVMAGMMVDPLVKHSKHGGKKNIGKWWFNDGLMGMTV